MTPLELLILVLLVLLLVGGWPAWHVHSYGYTPSATAFLLLLICLVILTRRRP